MLKKIVQIGSQILKKIKMSDSVAATSSVLQKDEGNKGKKRAHPFAKKKQGNKKGKVAAPPEPVEGLADRKRKVALMFGYCGKGYYGLQVNKGTKTIESDLLEALVKVGLIPQDHADNMSKMSFQRASRTDKGVSAVGNIVSLKMLLNVEDLVLKLNEALPDQIRVFGYTRTTKGFDSKHFCCGRTYIYLIPTFAFAPVEKNVTNEYRVTDDIIDQVNQVLQTFKGTHNFHNYTKQIKPNDPSAKRYIISFECSKPFVTDGMEFAQLKVRGQSFMLHQIRKMIGITVAVVKGYCGVEAIDKSWGPDKVDIPKVPGLGLVLETLHYDGYNKRFGTDGIHDPIDWDQYRGVMEDFKEKYIISEIVKTEKEESSMMKWLGTLINHSCDIQPYSGRQRQLTEKSIASRAARNAAAEDATKVSDEESDENIIIGKGDMDATNICEKDMATENDNHLNSGQMETDLVETDQSPNMGHSDHISLDSSGKDTLSVLDSSGDDLCISEDKFSDTKPQNSNMNMSEKNKESS